jgi:hypothetical protein
VPKNPFHVDVVSSLPHRHRYGYLANFSPVDHSNRVVLGKLTPCQFVRILIAVCLSVLGNKGMRFQSVFVDRFHWPLWILADQK